MEKYVGVLKIITRGFKIDDQLYTITFVSDFVVVPVYYDL